MCTTEVFGPSRHLQLTGVNMEGARMCVCIVAVSVLCVVLAVMCIYVIYKFLSLGLQSTARSEQAKLEIAKPSHQHGKQS
jgi:hypothetical protein